MINDSLDLPHRFRAAVARRTPVNAFACPMDMLLLPATVPVRAAPVRVVIPVEVEPDVIQIAIVTPAPVTVLESRLLTVLERCNLKQSYTLRELLTSHIETLEAATA